MASGDSLLQFLPVANEPPASAYATLDQRNNRYVLDFDGAADEEAVWSAALPNAYGGNGLTARVHVAFTSATVGTARFQAAIERTTDLGTDAFAAFQSVAVSAPGAAGATAICDIAFASGPQMANLAAGQLFRLKLRRDADGTSGTDDITTDAEVVLVDLRET